MMFAIFDKIFISYIPILLLRIVHTCALNDRGGVEGLFTVNILESNDEFLNSKWNVRFT